MTSNAQQVFADSPTLYEGQALAFMRKLLYPKELPTFSLGFVLKYCQEIKLDTRKNVAVVR